MMFVSPLIIGNALLLEPCLAQIWGYFLGLDHIPGVLTWVGTSLAAIGLYFFSKGGRQREKAKLLK